MSAPPYLVLQTHLTADELRPSMDHSATMRAFVVTTLQARGFRLRSLDDYDGTLEAQVDGTLAGLYVRQTLPRREPPDDD